jgi:hypothetical protein
VTGAAAIAGTGAGAELGAAGAVVVDVVEEVVDVEAVVPVVDVDVTAGFFGMSCGKSFGASVPYR